jgi:FkbM family methyltransferase
MLKTLRFIANHPLTRGRRLAGYARFAKWQILSRLQREVQTEWIDGSKLVVRNGMTGATGNIYCGLHEFPDMAFVLHLLLPGDLFVDVGANVGSYTILASAVTGANTIALEPDPGTVESLRRNVEANGVSDRVTIVEAAAGAMVGTMRFTVGLDTVNHIAGSDDLNTRDVRVTTLDALLRDSNPVLVKMDVEGFEADVVRGAKAVFRKPSLLAIETENESEEVVSTLREIGFARRHYDPRTRTLTDQKVYPEANALFVRHPDACEARLRRAKRRNILGNEL